MRPKQINPQRIKRGYRHYSQEHLVEALRLIDNGTSAYKASQMTGIPQSTIKDCRSGKIARDVESTGHPTIFTNQEELKLKDHILEMAAMGYGYTRSELLDLATDLGLFLKKVPVGQRLSESWLYLGFMKRHTDISFLKPRSLNMSRAKSVTQEMLDKYFKNLQEIMTKYDMENSPHLIYNIDETGFSPEHTPPKLACKKGQTPQAISSPRSTMITCIGACNAVGNHVPPFLIFKGKRMNDEITEGSSPGCGFAMSYSGWSNSIIFQNYLQNHFLKFVPRTDDSHVLVLYDGSTTHISVDLINWSLEQKIVLFVLPPHSSHLLQPLDIGCFSPLKKAYNSMAHRHMKEHPGEVINRYNMTSLICRSYTVAMTPLNIIHSFEKTGIYPLNPKRPTDKSSFKPAAATSQEQEEISNVTTCTTIVAQNIDSMLQARLISSSKKASSKRKRACSSIGGMAITEGPGYDIIQDQGKKKKEKKIQPVAFESAKTMTEINLIESDADESNEPVFITKLTSRGRAVKPKVPWSPSRPGPSAIHVDDSPSEHTDSDEDDSEPCCVCHQSSPPNLQNSVNLVIVNWAKCSVQSCTHWVHLRFCHQKITVARNKRFLCPCCENTSSEQ